MLITLVRHGETDFNKDKLIQGWIDNPLNELGIEQARKAGNYFKKKGYTFDKVYSSPLVRATRTAEEICEILGYEGDIILDRRFMERDFGEFDGKSVLEHLTHIFQDLPGDYEHHESIENRVFEGLNYVVKNGGNHILITCHSHTIKCIMTKIVEGFGYDSYLANTSINNIEYKDGKFFLKELNIIEHLD